MFSTKSNKSTINWKLLIGSSTVLGGGIVLYFTNLELVPVTKRYHFVLFNRDWDDYLGETLLDDEIEKYKNKLCTSFDNEKLAMVNKITSRLAYFADEIVVASDSALEESPFKWKLLVVDTDIQNAACLPGGKMIMYLEMVRAIERWAVDYVKELEKEEGGKEWSWEKKNEERKRIIISALACVIGHEMGFIIISLMNVDKDHRLLLLSRACFS